MGTWVLAWSLTARWRLNTARLLLVSFAECFIARVNRTGALTAVQSQYCGRFLAGKRHHRKAHLQVYLECKCAHVISTASECAAGGIGGVSPRRPTARFHVGILACFMKECSCAPSLPLERHKLFAPSHCISNSCAYSARSSTKICLNLTTLALDFVALF